MMKDPFYIQWHITNLCNLRCKHCYQDDFSKKSDLDWQGLKRVSDHLLTTIRDWDRTACIHLTGGEPLLKPELFPLLNHLDQHSMVEELERFEILLMFTAMKRNLRSLPYLFKLCQDMGIDGLIIERFIPLGRGREVMDEVLSKEEWKEMTGMLSDFISAEEEDFFFPYQAFQISFGGEESELLGAPCVVGGDGVCIMPAGNGFPCRRFPISIGNLLETSLKQIWDESEILEKLRKKENLN